MMSAQRRYQRATRSRRGGFAAVYFGLIVFGLLGVSALVIDMGALYKDRADAQKAADAAALAGAFVLSQRPTLTGCTGTDDLDGKNGCGGKSGSLEVARLNGFDDAASNVVVTASVTSPKTGAPDGNWWVTITKNERFTFAGVIGIPTGRVQAVAAALYRAQLDIPISPTYYGVNDGPVTFSQFGPSGFYGNGDPYSVTTNNGAPNTEYDPDGYDYKILVPDPTTYKNNTGDTKVEVEIFDPDCYNSGGQTDASSTAVDELRVSSGGQGSISDATTTQYSLYWDHNTPSDPSDDILIAQKSYGGADSATDMKWVTPSNFNFDLDDARFKINGVFQGNFRLNVLTTAGSSENGYNLRAGPIHQADANGVSNMNPTGWHDAFGTTSKNGTQIAAEGHLPMNFNIDGVADILLGYVPATAAGGKFFIDKFDTDVGARSVYYTCDSLPGQTFAGTLAPQATWAQDTITLPSNYTGGNWHAIYDAGSNDTSAWSLSYTKGSGSPGEIKLVE